MANERTAREIAGRFEEEQSYIRRYVQLLRSRLVVNSSDVWDVRGVLQSWNIISTKTNLEQERQPPAWTPQQIENEVAALAASVPTLNKSINEQYAYILKLSEELDSPLITSTESEWMEYLEEHYADALLTMDHDEILTQCLHKNEWQCADAETPLDAAMVRKAIAHATGVRSFRKVRALEHAKKSLEDMQLLLRVSSPDAEINILRQGFILLMTAFDAAVFDLVRTAFRKRFFQLIGAFGKQEKVPLEVIGAAGSFEAWRDQMIEDQLKKRYVKDLLGLLQVLGVSLVDEETGDRHVHLVELVLRRNVHVHNRGVIDERYLEADSQSRRPKYNLYDLKLGDVACIDADYLEMADRLCENCVDRLADWADG